MKIHHPHRPETSGIALIIVMVMIVFLGILAGGFAYSMKVETTLARNAEAEPNLEWMGRSGVELARYVLSQQMLLAPQFDCLNQKWAGGPGNSNDILSAISLDNVQLGMGTISVKIIDQERKFNINIVQADILNKALGMLGVNVADMSSISDSIQDWVDPDDKVRLSGAESEYYLSLDPPYYAKNGPLDDISELLLIRGISPELYWGAAGPNHAPSAVQTSSGGGTWSPSAMATNTFNGGLVDLFCAISGAQININTASSAVLQLMPGVDEHVASAIIMARAGPDGVDGSEDDLPFHSPQELINVPGMNPQLVSMLTRYCGVRSGTFEVHVDARISNYKRHYVGMVRRNSQRDLRLLYFRMD